MERKCSAPHGMTRSGQSLAGGAQMKPSASLQEWATISGSIATTDMNMGFDGRLITGVQSLDLDRSLSWMLLNGMLEGYELAALSTASGADFSPLLALVPQEPG